MAYRWVYTQPEREESVQNLQEELNVPEEIAQLLAIRGIESFEKAKSFFRPEKQKLHDPFLMKDMEAELRDWLRQSAIIRKC